MAGQGDRKKLSLIRIVLFSVTSPRISPRVISNQWKSNQSLAQIVVSVHGKTDSPSFELRSKDYDTGRKEDREGLTPMPKTLLP